MKLQIALDEVTIEQGLLLCEQVREQIDIIEIGTPFLVREGLHAVRAFREHFPEKEILADAKIMDAGEWEAKMCFEAGADYVTVLAVTDLLTIKECVKTAAEFGKQIVADMICVDNFPKRIEELEAAGIVNIAVHTGIDQQTAGRTPLQDLRQIKAYAKQATVSVAGGINVDTVEQYRLAGADVVIVGGGIAHAEDPVKAAGEIAEKIHRPVGEYKDCKERVDNKKYDTCIECEDNKKYDACIDCEDNKKYDACIDCEDDKNYDDCKNHKAFCPESVEENHFGSRKLERIINELSQYSPKVKQEEVYGLAKACAEAKRIFVAGAGRSGFAARGFANRLMHLGLTAYFVGDPVTPSIGKGDLLVVGSGSGTTAGMLANVNKAKAAGASVGTLTIFPDAAIGQAADIVITIPGATPKKGNQAADTATSIQPMGSLFEQLSWLVYDSIILELMGLTGETGETMYPRHANLE